MEDDIDFDRIFLSWQTDCMSTFNLILTTIVVTLPKGFADVGFVWGFGILCVVALLSYLSSTFILEVQSIYGALHYCHGRGGEQRTTTTPATTITTTSQIHASYNPPGRVVWNINQSFIIEANSRMTTSSRNEIAPIPSNTTRHSTTQLQENDSNDSTKPYETIGELIPNTSYNDLCQAFLPNQICLNMYRIAICLYLYGIISIHLIALAKSLTSIVCFDPYCFMGDEMNECKIFTKFFTIDIYRYILIVVVFIVSSFICLRLSPSKSLLCCMVLLRWCAFISMIVLAFSRIAKGLDDGPENRKINKLYSIPTYIGICMNVFMIQYSLPNNISNVADKDRFPRTLCFSYITGVTAIALILITATFAFTPSEIQDIYSLNFTAPNFFRYFLELFPVYSSSVFLPALGIALRKTIKTILPWTCAPSECYTFVKEIVYQLLTIVPPITIAFISCDIEMLVAYTGLFSGGCCGFIVPVIFLYYARKEKSKFFGKYFVRYSSPFQHPIWLLLLLIWYCTCFGFMMYCNFKGN